MQTEKPENTTTTQPVQAAPTVSINVDTISDFDTPTALRSRLLGKEALMGLSPKVSSVRCNRCSNACLLTVSNFGKDPDTGRTRRFITGNRCERGFGNNLTRADLPNLFTFKRQRLFDGRPNAPYIPLTPESATRPTIGLPRVLNMFENYPFWFTFFTELGFSVLLSEETTKSTYSAGIESMPSESVCYPAKLAHGHIMDLIKPEREVDIIFMPCLRYERKEDPDATNQYNCPVVVSYPEVIKLNVEELTLPDTPTFMNPFLPYQHRARFIERVQEEFAAYYQAHPKAKGTVPSKAELARATDIAWAEDDLFKSDVRAAGEAALDWMQNNSAHGIVLAGRPYHLDIEINHAIPELLAGYGLAVLTEDSISHIVKPERPLRVVDQWMYHSRLYAAAKLCCLRDDLDLIQLNSFGCGLDAITTDQVQEILEGSGKLYTVLKIDEVSNLGAARIRVRSLLAALRNKQVLQEQTVDKTSLSATGTTVAVESPVLVAPDAAAPAAAAPVAPAPASVATPVAITPTLTPASPPAQSSRVQTHRAAASTAIEKPQFSKQMKTDRYTILCPQMAPIHFELLNVIFDWSGYNLKLLPSVDFQAVEAGLKFANNDVCYPSIIVTGQIMEAVMSGEYDMDRTAVLISQTGGGCRATNYIGLIRKALREAGFAHVPVIGMSFHSLGETNPGFNITIPMARRTLYALYYGDLLMQCLYRTRPYERDPGSAEALFRKWMDICKAQVAGRISLRIFTNTVRQIVHEFDTMPLVNDRSKPRVGVVGEILVKFHPTANNEVVRLIEAEGCEAVVPGLSEFLLFGISGGIYQHKTLAKKKRSEIGSRASIALLNAFRRPMNKALRRSQRLEPAASIYQLAAYAEEFLSLCNSMGEGWLLTAEMVELIHAGVPNIVCAQPFACLPNHVTGKGVIKALRSIDEQSNIVAVDYDPGASEVNQLNRIKLMISIAKDNFEANRAAGTEAGAAH